MKLSIEQWFEIFMALDHGVSNASWEGASSKPWSTLDEVERAKILATIREREAAKVRLTAGDAALQRLNQQYLDRMSLAATKAEDEREKEQRDAFYARPPKARPRGLGGLKTAVNDLLSQAHMFSLHQRRSVDHRLMAHGLPSLDTLMRRLDRRVARILKRGTIKNEEEYYVVQEALSDLQYDVSDQDRERLDAMAAAFQRPVSRKSSG